MLPAAQLCDASVASHTATFCNADQQLHAVVLSP